MYKDHITDAALHVLTRTRSPAGCWSAVLGARSPRSPRQPPALAPAGSVRGCVQLPGAASAPAANSSLARRRCAGSSVFAGSRRRLRACVWCLWGAAAVLARKLALRASSWAVPGELQAEESWAASSRVDARRSARRSAHRSGKRGCNGSHGGETKSHDEEIGSHGGDIGSRGG